MEVKHQNTELFPALNLPKNPNEKPNFTNNYLKYFWAGYQAALLENNLKEYVGIKLLITGNVPLAAGLSSSASLVVSAGVMALYANI